MPVKRIWFQLSIFGAAVALAVALAFWAEHACRAVWLPGETGWSIRHILGEAIARLLSRAAPEADYCAGGTLAVGLNAIVPWLGVGLLLIALSQIAYEVLRAPLKRRLMVARGGHTVLLGNADDIDGLMKEAGPARRVLLVPWGAERAALAGRYWRHVTAPPGAGADSLGLSRARRIYAVSGSDFYNRDLAVAARSATPAGGDIVLRIESAAMRAAQSFSGDWQMEEFSLLQGMMRQGATLGDPAPQFRRGTYPAHIVLCGGGPWLDELALHLAGFGYGMEASPPLFTIIQTDGRMSPALARLARMPSLVTISHDRVDTSDTFGLERALIAAFAVPQSPAAIHCIDDSASEVASVAMVAAKAIAAMDIRGVPVLAYGQSATFAVPGVTAIETEDLARAISRKGARDRMAQAVHAHYLELQRRTLGTDFGQQEAENPWEQLSMAYRDDNRAVADHIDHVLRASGFERRVRDKEAAIFTAEELERMARMAHARWMAARMLKGWRYGAVRDNKQMLHPSLVPYDELSEPEKEKDRDQIRSIPAILALLGEAVYRAPALEPGR